MNQLQRRPESRPQISRATPVDEDILAVLQESKIGELIRRCAVSPERADRLTMQLSQIALQNRAVRECAPFSIASAVMTLAAEDLELGEEVYVIPRWDARVGSKVLTVQTSYKGEIARIRRATKGKVTLRCAIIREGDTFKYSPHLDQPIVHEVDVMADFALEVGEIRNPIGAWAAVLEEGRWHQPTVMGRAELIGHRDQYVQKDRKTGKIASDSIWLTDPDSAWLKTVIRKAAALVGRGGALAELEDEQDRHAQVVVEKLQPAPVRPHGPEAAHAALEVGEKALAHPPAPEPARAAPEAPATPPIEERAKKAREYLLQKEEHDDTAERVAQVMEAWIEEQNLDLAISTPIADLSDLQAIDLANLVGKALRTRRA